MKKSVKDIDVKGKLVFVRCDFNVPMNEDGTIADDTRIVSALDTIKYLKDNKAKIILASHFGKPKGEVKKELSMKPIAKRLSEKLGVEVKLSEDVIGESAKKIAESLQEGEIGLLENLRFDPREEKNEESFCEELASLGGGIEVYVNDAFGTAHRAHGSTEGITKKVKGEKVAGLLMQKEIMALDGVLENPEKPFVAILGGAKVSDKIGVIENLIEKVDKLVIGGAMATTFLKAQGYQVGDSRIEEDKLEIAKKLLEKAKQKGIEIVFPIDVHIGKVEKDTKLEASIVETAEDKIADVENGVESGWQIFDGGEKTIKAFLNAIEGGKTIIWNGPLGYTEAPKYAKVTEEVANAIGKSGAKCVIGGGDSVAAIHKIEEKNGESFSNVHKSTGGGATLEYMEGKVLPGIAAIDNK